MNIKITQMDFYSLTIPFRTTFSHASASRAKTSSVWIEATSTQGTVGYGESCPRTYVTSEDITSAHDFLKRYEPEIVAQIHNMKDLRQWVAQHQQCIDENPAAWCAIELAILDLLGKECKESVEALLGLSPLHGAFAYSAVIGDGDAKQFASFLQAYQRAEILDYKIKLSGDLQRDVEKFSQLRSSTMPGIHVRVDANNLWPDSETAVKYLRALNYPLSAIEEPLHSKNIEQLREVSNQLDMPIILDESFLRENQFETLESDPEHWIINLRVSKMGGLLRSLDIVKRARARHIPLIVGAQVGETSLLTRAALTIMHAARDICVAREGAFGTRLLTHDICDIPLMFGQGGILDADTYLYFRNDGLGIRISDMARPFLKAIRT